VNDRARVLAQLVCLALAVGLFLWGARLEQLPPFGTM
jgi:hypothetical protein